MASTKTVLITGCSQGIGLEFVRHYVAQGWNVIATARNPSKTPDLANAKPNRMEILDVVNEASIAGGGYKTICMLCRIEQSVLLRE